MTYTTFPLTYEDLRADPVAYWTRKIGHMWTMRFDSAEDREEIRESVRKLRELRA